MGNFTIEATGQGPHHNDGNATDADALFSKFVAAMMQLGIQVFSARFSHNDGAAVHDVIAAPTHTETTASLDQAAAGTSAAPAAQGTGAQTSAR